MKATILRYNIIIRKEDLSYIADVPTLGISDFGKSLQQAKENVKQAIECHIEGLVKTGGVVPKPDTEDYYISTTEIRVPYTVNIG